MAGDPVGVKANVVQKAVGDATAQRARGQKCCVFFFFKAPSFSVCDNKIPNVGLSEWFVSKLSGFG